MRDCRGCRRVSRSPDGLLHKTLAIAIVEFRTCNGATAVVRGEAIRALLVEDNPGDATLAQCLLAESLGPTVDTCCAERLSAAVSRLEEGTFDVVLLDLLLPDASGLEALQQIVASFPFMPVVVLTGVDDEGIVTDALSEGAQEFLVKGVALCDELGRAVEKAIYRKRAELSLMRRSEPKKTELIDGDAIVNPAQPAHVLVIGSMCLDLLDRAVDRYESLFVLHEAHTLAEARQSLACRPYDVILLDLELPDAWASVAYEDALESSRGSPMIVLGTWWAEPPFAARGTNAPFAIVRRGDASPDLLRRLLISAVLRNRALAPPVDAAMETMSQRIPNVWRH